MADFPTTIYSPRTKENRSGVIYEPLKTKKNFAEDITLLDAEVVAIETEFQNNVPTSKIRFSVEGGLMVKLTNKTGGATVKGKVVMSNSGQNNSVVLITDGSADPFGVFYENGIADGSETWVVVSGIAYVYFIGNTTRGQFCRTFLSGESGYVIGEAIAENKPTAPFSSDKHFIEIGHCLESRTGAGLAKIVMHFN